MNNSKVIGNSINHRDYRLDHDYINQNEDDTIRLVVFLVCVGRYWKFTFTFGGSFGSNKSYGSHKNRAFKDESHKGSIDSLDGEEKKDASKEDLEQEEGTRCCSQTISFSVNILHAPLDTPSSVLL